MRIKKPRFPGDRVYVSIVHMMITVTPRIHLPEEELKIEYVRSSGPGGQNVNKVATAVQLRFDVRRSPSLPEDVRRRLVNLAGRRMTSEGILVLDARRFRTQEQNRTDALDRLRELVARAAVPPKRRKATRPTKSSLERRLKRKRLRGERKIQRKSVYGED
ncbi:MAG: alternative ribosome rescue aminoacyl-tRNA hydrolase ArfB [Anaerolineales bacterium]